MEADVDLAGSGLSRLQAQLARQRARLVTTAVVCGYLVLLEALGGPARWGRLGVPAASMRFLDLRSLIGSWECTRRGIAVLPTDPCDPYGRPANFPRLWLVPSFLGLGQGSAIVLGVLLAAVFLAAAVAVVPPGAGVGTGLVYALALCSPAVMLGVERGNPDLALFPLVLGAVLVTTRTLGRQLLTGVLLLAAALLKLYPVLAVGFLVRRATRASLVLAASVAGCFALYVLATYDYIHRILVAVPQSSVLSYGVRRTSEWSSALAERAVGGFSSYRAWDVVLAACGLVLGWLAGRRLRARLSSPAEAAERRDLDLFWAGACIYVGSYLVFRNFDYRLVFVLLTVPQLVRWTRARHRLAYVTVPALFATLWLDEWTRMPVLRPLLRWWDRTTAVGPDALPLTVAVIAQFALFAVFVAWLFATAPRTWPRRPAAPSAD